MSERPKAPERHLTDAECDRLWEALRQPPEYSDREIAQLLESIDADRAREEQS